MKKVSKKISKITKVFLVFAIIFSNLTCLKTVFAYEENNDFELTLNEEENKINVKYLETLEEEVNYKIGMEIVDLTSKFNRASIENLDVKYFCIDMKVDDKIYNVKNIPMKMLNMGEKKVACYIAEQIIVYKIQEGILDYEKFLLE